MHASCQHPECIIYIVYNRGFARSRRGRWHSNFIVDTENGVPAEYYYVLVPLFSWQHGYIHINKRRGNDRVARTWRKSFFSFPSQWDVVGGNVNQVPLESHKDINPFYFGAAERTRAEQFKRCGRRIKTMRQQVVCPSTLWRWSTFARSAAYTQTSGKMRKITAPISHETDGDLRW